MASLFDKLKLPPHQSGELPLPDGSVLPYVLAGTGESPIVMLPGFWDGLLPVHEAGEIYARRLQPRLKTHLFVILGRRHPLPENFGIEKLAEDAALAVEKLGIGSAYWECTSAGGPIGQALAVKRPDLVRGLILSCTFHRSSPHTQEIFQDWLALLQEGQWEDFVWSLVLYTHRPGNLRRDKLTRPYLVGPERSLKYPQRIINLLAPLKDFDHRLLLPDIQAPAVVIGGLSDRLIPAEIQREMSDLITTCRARLYPNFGHHNDVENPEHAAEVEKFIQRTTKS